MMVGFDDPFFVACKESLAGTHSIADCHLAMTASIFPGCCYKFYSVDSHMNGQ